MKILDDGSVFLGEKVKIELSVKEMALIAEVLGSTSKNGRKEVLMRSREEGYFSHGMWAALTEAEDLGDTQEIFETFESYLRRKGVYGERSVIDCGF